MSATKDILGLIPTAQAANLLSSNIKSSKKKKKNLLGQGVDNIFGIGVIGAESDIIAGM